MRIISMLFVLLFISVQAMALGKIAGKVTDEKTGESVIGANVIVKGTSTGTVTDVDGNFTLNIAAGTYTIEVKYIGYQTKEIADVKVAGNGTTSLNVSISESSSTTLNEVVITTTLKKENVSALYIMQKNNVSVSSGISADIIQRSPDRNTGEVLKRVSGTSLQNGKFVIIRGLNDRYNVAMVNGAQMPSTEPDRKAFSFDVIPSNLIDNILINKTASPDMPGDMAGGIVQVLTKDVPEENFLNASVSVGYNNQATFKDIWTNKRSTGEYFGFANNATGLPKSFGTSREDYMKLSNDEKTAAAKELPNNYATQKSSATPNTSVQLSYGNAARFKNGNKFGSVVGISFRNGYNLNPDFQRGTWDQDAIGLNNSSANDNLVKFSSSLAGLANFAYVAGKHKISFRNLYTTLHDQTNYAREGTNRGALLQVQAYSAIPYDRNLYNTQLEGDHAFGKKNIKLNWNLNYSALNAKQTDLRTVFYGKTAEFDEQGNVVPNNGIYTVNDRNSRRFFSNLQDRNYSGNVSATVPFEMFKQTQSLKVGYMGLMRNRTFGARIFQYYYSSQINPALPELPYDQVFAPENLAYNSGFELQEITNPTDAYEAGSFLNAGYVMLDNHISEQWRISWGARVESYTQNLQATDLSKKKIDTTSVVMDILPSLNLSYSPGEKTKIRLSGSRTVNRPEFREIAPFQFLDLENNWTLIGNPNLQRANITNADLRYEYYPEPGETITAGVFFKHFQNPIENKMNDQSNLDLLIFGFQNAPSATAYGAEIDIRKNLSFLSEDTKWLENLIIGGNVTYVKSQVDVSSFGIAQDRPLQGQSPYLLNFSILYNDTKTGIGVSALYNRAGERIYIVGTNTIPTTWENSRNVLDFQLSKSLFKKKAELKFTISDIFNQPYVFYWNGDTRNGYNAKTDKLFQSYKLGTTYTLGFSYKFGK
jgi:TonB-dependent receptor